MHFIKKLPVLIVILIKLFAVHLFLFTLYRVGFCFYFFENNGDIPLKIFLNAFYIGFKFDVRLIALVLLPVLFFSWIPFFDLIKADSAKRIWMFYLIIVFTSVNLLYFSDFGYYAYLGTSRIDATILRFFYNPKDSFNMVVQSYPVFRIMLSYFFIIALYIYTIHLVIHKSSTLKAKYSSKFKKTVIYAVFIFIWLFGIYGKISYYPLRWCDAFFSSHSFTSILALNPVLYFFDTFKNKEVKYDLEKVKKYYPDIKNYLKLETSEQENIRFIRTKNFKGFDKSLNIVVVILESFAFYKTGCSKNPLNPTPNFDKLASSGILFNRFYTPHGGTARSIFTFLTGLPDVESIRTSSRNPLVVNQHSIVNAFEEYEKYYFIGGSANWGNIRGLLSNNISDLKIYEEGDYHSPRIDVWGISDLNLFLEVNQVLKKVKQPFFAVIHTAGNHKPYTIPDDNKGFQKIKKSDMEVKKYGFRSNDAYNAYRFMDHSIGVFMDQVEQENYFDNTYFVFFGDHGLIRHAEHISTGENKLEMTDFHVPFVIYSPKWIKKSKIITHVASEVDVLPTLAALTKTSYVNSTFGRDLFDEKYNSLRYAFTITHHKVHEIGIITEKFYYRQNEDGTNKNLYSIFSKTPLCNVTDKFPEKSLELERLTAGIYETTKYLRYHNK